jgi:hypothetical protein
MSTVLKFALCVAVILVALGASAKGGVRFRKTYVDPTVSVETNPCDSPQRPCKKIADALPKTASGGTVILLHADQENDESIRCTVSYDPVTLTEAVRLEASPTLRAKPCFNVGSSNGVTVKPNSDSAAVSLKGLRFIGQGGFVGVEFHRGRFLVVENCAFQGLNHGVTSVKGSLTLRNCMLNAGTPIRLEANDNVKKAEIVSCIIRGHGDAAIEVNQNGSAVMRDTTIDGDYHNGILIKGSGLLIVENSRLVGTFDRGIVKVSSAGSLTLKNTEVLQTKCCAAFFSCEPGTP